MAVLTRILRRTFLVVLLIFGNSKLSLAQSWQVLSPLNHPRFEASTVQYDEDIYVFNGFGPGVNIEPTVEKFDAATKQWSVVSRTSALVGNAVTHNGIIRTGNEAWVIGGRKGSHPGAVSDLVWKFNLSNNSWKTGPKLPVPSAAGGAALVNNHIHWIGGLDPQARCDVPNHFVYDLNLPSAGWQDISSVAGMPQPRNHFATIVHEGLIYTIGGQFGHDNCPGKPAQDTNLVHAFNPQTRQWTRKANLPMPQSHIEPSTFSYGGAIYVAGGETSGNKIHRYDPSRNIWESVGDLPESLIATVARVIDNRLVLGSGGAPNFRSPTVRAHSTDMTPLLLPNTVDNETEVMADTNSESLSDNPDNSNATSGVGDALHSAVGLNESLLSLEAEYFDTDNDTNIHSWITTDLNGSSNNAAVVTTPDIGHLSRTAANSPGLSYFAFFDRPGIWYVWVRGWGDTNSAGEGRSDSLHSGLNGQLSLTADKIDMFPVGWHWSNSTRDNARATLSVPTSGLHALNLWMREDGLYIDKIVVTTDPDYVPTGTGPAHNDGASLNESVNTTPVDTTPVDTTPVDTTPVDTTPVDTTPVDTTPVDTTPVDTTPVDTTPVDTTPVDTTPVDTTPVNTTPVDTGLHQSTNGLVSIEVENYTTRTSASNRQWVRDDRPNASGNGAMVTTPDTGIIRLDKRNSPEMTYRVYFNQAGTYTVWMRGWGDTVGNEGKSDSVHVGINGTLSTAQALQNFPSGWNWSREKRGGGFTTLVIPSTGEHDINIWMREDGLVIDKLVLSRNANFTPTDQGPAETFTADNQSDNNSINSNEAPDTDSSASSPPIDSARAWSFLSTSDASSVVARHEAGGVEFDGKLFVIGGRGIRAVSVFDPAMRSWEHKSPPPMQINHVQPVVYDDKIWLIGGFSGDFPNEQPVAEILSYTPSTDTWSQEGVIPVGRRRGSAGAAFHNGLIYIVGGNTNGHNPGAQPWFDSFNPATGEWQILPDAPSSRDHTTIAISNQRLVVAGGRQTAFPNTFGNMLAETDVFDFRTNSWSVGRSIPTMRAGTMTVRVGNEVVVIGGETAEPGLAQKEVEAYNVNSNSWRSLQSLNVGRHSGAAAIVNGQIHVVSGSERRGGSPESVVHEVLPIAP